MSEADDGPELDLGGLFGFTTGDWPTTEAVHRSSSGRVYFGVDGRLLGDDVRARTEPLLDAFEQAADAVRVGDMVSDDSPTILIRGVAADRVYAVLIVPPYVDVVAEIYTRFDDGSSLTTTTNPFGGLGGPEQGIYRNAQPPEATPEELIAAHQESVRQHSTARSTLPLPVQATLEGLAESFDEFLRRQTG